jgi:hypothetical protein
MSTQAATEAGQIVKCPVSKRTKWVGRLGAAAFLFFLIKGLMWLAVPAVLALWAAR